MLAWLVRSPRDTFVSNSSVLRLQVWTNMSGFLLGFWGSNSGLQQALHSPALSPSLRGLTGPLGSPRPTQEGAEPSPAGAMANSAPPGGVGNGEDKDDRNLGRHLPGRKVSSSRRLLGTLWLEESEAQVNWAWWITSVTPVFRRQISLSLRAS